MVTAVPKERNAERENNENRVALTPEGVKRLKTLGVEEIIVETGAGEEAGFSDEDYTKAGAEISGSFTGVLEKANLVLRLNQPSEDEIKHLKKGSVHISFLDPYNNRDTVEALQAREIAAISMEMIPRTTRAQKMDALSSQASLAGYVTVIEAAHRINKIFPMMMTPAGTISPVRVFIIGAGVAGLQAIATAKRLGARVEAFDTRPVVEEQVASLGAKFVKLDLGETGQTKDGYAKALTEEQLALQQELMQEKCRTADIVITTAKLFGRKAPLLIPKKTIEAMKPGSVIVDLAVDTGGNVEGSKPGETVVINGVQIVGLANYPGEVAANASQMYSSNLINLISEFWNKESSSLVFPEDDDIVQGALITREGSIVHGGIKKHYGME